MPLWQRLLITLAVMLLASYLVGLLWHWIFTADIPSYLSGAVGGLTAVPTWEFLRQDPSQALTCHGAIAATAHPRAGARIHDITTGYAPDCACAGTGAGPAAPLPPPLHRACA